MTKSMNGRHLECDAATCLSSKFKLNWQGKMTKLLNGRLFEGGAAKNGAAAPNIML